VHPRETRRSDLLVVGSSSPEFIVRADSAAAQRRVSLGSRFSAADIQGDLIDDVGIKLTPLPTCLPAIQG
jgi:hypothetical protein